MSELSEKTRIGLQVGTAVVCIIAIFTLGQKVGSWQNERDNTAKAIDRHDVEIRQLRDAVTATNQSLIEIKTTQNATVESINTAVRQTTFLITEMTSIRAALQERGVRLSRNDDP